MAYERVNWENLPSTNTPVNATNLNKMDAGIKDLETEIENLETEIENLETEIENIQSFSTNEVEIGKWVNNKTLYRKVYGGTVSNIASKCNADAKTFILNMYGYAVASNGVYMPMNNSFTNSAYVWSAWWAADMAVAVNFGSNFTNNSAVIIVMEYTKD